MCLSMQNGSWFVSAQLRSRIIVRKSAENGKSAGQREGYKRTVNEYRTTIYFGDDSSITSRTLRLTVLRARILTDSLSSDS